MWSFALPLETSTLIQHSSFSPSRDMRVPPLYKNEFAFPPILSLPKVI